MKEFIEYIRSYHTEKYNFNGLADFIEVNNFKIKFSKFAMNGIQGMTLFDEIFILDNPYNKEKMFITILHEIGHCKLALKMGYEKHVEYHNSTLKDMDFSLVMDEEVLVDRYAEFCYFKLNGRICKKYNQGLDDPYRRDRYEHAMTQIYYGLPHDIELLNNYAKTNLLC